MAYKMKHKTEEFPYKTPSIVASKSAKDDYNADNEKTNEKETGSINTTPNTRPPLFSDAETHTKATKSLNTKKASNKKRADAERALEAKEDAEGK